MNVDCNACGAHLKVNRNLAGTTLPCPQCGARLQLPDAPPPGRVPAPAARPGRRRQIESRKAAKPQRKSRPLPLSLSLLGAQTVLFLLAATCFLGAFFQHAWQPPATSLYGAEQLVLAGLGAGLAIAAFAAYRYPITSTLTVAIGLLVLAALHYRTDRVLDASHVLVISLSMLSLWLAMEHRGVT